MEINHNTERCRVWLEQAGHTAYVEYTISNNCLDIIHTLVPPQLEGQGIAACLVRYAYDYALQEKLTPAATCSYAQAWLKRHPEYSK